MIALEARPQSSSAMAFATPILAVVLTMLCGGVLFAVLGKNPIAAITTIFWDPLFGEFSFFYRPQLLIKSAPLILIALGLSLGFRAGIWNIGAEGQYIHTGGHLRRWRRAGVLPVRERVHFPVDGSGWRVGRLGLGDDSGPVAGKVWHERDFGFAHVSLRR